LKGVFICLVKRDTSTYTSVTSRTLSLTCLNVIIIVLNIKIKHHVKCANA